MRVSFTKIKFFSTFLFMLFLTVSAWSQSQGPLDIALRHLEENKAKWDLTEQDIADLIVTDNYLSTPSQATMMYLTQRYQGVKVYNAIYNVAISEEGKVVHAGNRIIPNISEKVNTTAPSLNAKEALESAITHLELELSSPLQQIERKNNQEFVFAKDNYSRSDIPVSLQLVKVNDNQVKLAWEVIIDMTTKNDAWNIKVDAVTGEIIEKITLIIKCQFGDNHTHKHNVGCSNSDQIKVNTTEKEISVADAMTMTMQGGSYNVYAEVDGDGNLHPIESPTHGDRSVISGFEDSAASPYGWHDTNGQEGAEFTITRGNNVHAYLDLNGTNGPSEPEPDGGMELLFDFPLDEAGEPESFEPAAVTNAFFMVNYLHDFSYAYGFDSPAGNYQANTYGAGGAGGDYILVDVHDGSETNNANFNVVPDGANGRMQMYLWNIGVSGLLTVNEPAEIAGVYETQAAVGNWGAPVTEVPLTGEVAIVDDGTGVGTDGCSPLINPAEVSGKIAIVDRGICYFSEKALIAQNAGAIGVIICNFEDNLPPLGGGTGADQVTIPVLGISSGDCATIRGFAGNGLSISFVDADPGNSGPEFLSGALENGIIAHEFGHGVSLRLVGGPNSPGCLSNGEQMGEGISDFFTLVTTVKPGDTGEMRRGIGAYVERQAPDGGGIRRYPYSTDMSVNPLTYKDITAQLQWPRGEIWTLALWEMYWLLVEKYDFDPDLVYGTGGNNIAVQLVVEGMKLTPCGPGYLDARDAILAVDELMYDGANQCLIWEAFAKRGMGVFADQVSAGNTSDGIEDFTRPNECIKEVLISKTVTDLVVAGELIDVTLNVSNFKDETATNVVVTDEIPAGAIVAAGSASNGGMVNGNTIVFNLGDMASTDEVTITYQLETDPGIRSETFFYDDVENDGDQWDIEILNGSNIWDLRDDSLSNSGEKAWFVQAVNTESEQTFFTFDPIQVTGTQPVLRFYHWYDTEHAVDGGIVEVSNDGGANWDQIGDHMFREGYPRILSYQTFVIPFLSAFSGESNLFGQPDFIATYVDLSAYAGDDIQLRFRFGTDAGTSGIGWFVDDIELMDMKNYQGEACVTSDDGDNACANAAARGTIVESSGTTSISDPFDTNMKVNVFPNPAGDILNLHILNDKAANASAQMFTIDGKEVLDRSFRTSNGTETMTFNVGHLPTGMYFIKVSTEEGIVVEKVSIK